MNVLRHPNTTNIHTHGLHVSSMAPGDDPFQIIAPGSELTSHFQIPAYHMGGTHWYHPHHHGSTALQAGAPQGELGPTGERPRCLDPDSPRPRAEGQATERCASQFFPLMMH